MQNRRKKYGSTDGLEKSYEQSQAEEIIKQTYCKCSFIIEPVVFLQNFASSIIGIAFGQFIYARILNRLLDANDSVQPFDITNATYHHIDYWSRNFTTTFHTTTTTPFPDNNNNHLVCNSNTTFLNGTSDFDKIRLAAQRETAHFSFLCSLFGGIPCVIATNLLGVNCSKLGRKLLLILGLSVMTLRCIVFLFISIYPSLPDYLFYTCALIDGLSGSSGLFGLVLHCYIADLTTAKNRSYRLTFINYIGGITSLIISYTCGYVIKYLGYVYIFASALCFYFLSLVYLIVFVPEPLSQVRSRGLAERLRGCSVSRIKNSFHVLARDKHPVIAKKEVEEVDEDGEEAAPLVANANDELRDCGAQRQRKVIIIEIVANLIYCGGAAGIGVIFTLYIMNTPFCWDSVNISTYTLYSTVVSICLSLFVSRFIRVNDILINIASVSSYISSLFIFAFAKNSFGIFLATTVGSISGLEYGYVRSLVSKLVTKHEVTDALTFIACVDTLTNVLASIIFPLLYAQLVGTNIRVLFYIVIGIVSVTLTLHIVAYVLYKKPVVNVSFIEESSSSIGVASIENLEPEPVFTTNVASNQVDSISQLYNSIVIASHENNDDNRSSVTA